ncbi:MAG: MBL fold metallo-hydrolase [Muribaculaceae bacterium]|nr:MBL fold metallo-hydrolase [Muribaculaceae bacterium]
MLKKLFLLSLIMLTCLACNSKKPEQIKVGEDDINHTKSGKDVSFLFIKHASFVIEYDGLTIQIDPVRTLNDGDTTDYSTFPKADFILVTHEHFDHFDKDAIATLTGEKTQVILNKNCAEMLGSGTAMGNGETLKLRDDITIEAVPAYNTTPDRQQFHPKGRDNGYVLTLDGLRIYIAGDTEDIPEMSQLKDIDIAFLPCNQPYTMTPQQLAHAATMIKPKMVYPYHFSDTSRDEMQKALDGANIKATFRNMQ